MSSSISERAAEAYAKCVAAHKTGVWNEEAEKVVNEEWKLILARYPLLFTGRNIGLYAGLGWWPALEDCFGEITGILNGYQGLVFNAAQIKEKFGGLRFYYDLQRADGSTITDELLKEARLKINEAIGTAERVAGQACETCGQPGKRRDGSWIRTLCDEHAKKG